MNILPDFKPKQLQEKIAPKCIVLYFPIQMVPRRESLPETSQCSLKLCAGDHLKHFSSPNDVVSSEEVKDATRCTIPLECVELGKEVKLCAVRDHASETVTISSNVAECTEGRIVTTSSSIGEGRTVTSSNTAECTDSRIVTTSRSVVSEGARESEEGTVTLITESVEICSTSEDCCGHSVLHIVWPHRW